MKQSELIYLLEAKLRLEWERQRKLEDQLKRALEGPPKWKVWHFYSGILTGIGVCLALGWVVGNFVM